MMSSADTAPPVAVTGTRSAWAHRTDCICGRLQPTRDRGVSALLRPSDRPATSAVAPTKSAGCGLRGLRLATWNVRSLGNKFLDVANITHDLGILVFNESWHSSSSDVPVRESPTGLIVLRPATCDRWGTGGTGSEPRRYRYLFKRRS